MYFYCNGQIDKTEKLRVEKVILSLFTIATSNFEVLPTSNFQSSPVFSIICFVYWFSFSSMCLAFEWLLQLSPFSSSLYSFHFISHF